MTVFSYLILHCDLIHNGDVATQNSNSFSKYEIFKSVILFLKGFENTTQFYNKKINYTEIYSGIMPI
jgi:hypothetical protein